MSAQGQGASRPPARLVLGGYLTHRPECLGTYVLWAHVNGHGQPVDPSYTRTHPVWKHEDEDMYMKNRWDGWVVQAKAHNGSNRGVVRLCGRGSSFPHLQRQVWQELGRSSESGCSLTPGWKDAPGLLCIASPPGGQGLHVAKGKENANPQQNALERHCKEFEPITLKCNVPLCGRPFEWRPQQYYKHGWAAPTQCTSCRYGIARPAAPSAAGKRKAFDALVLEDDRVLVGGGDALVRGPPGAGGRRAGQVGGEAGAGASGKQRKLLGQAGGGMRPDAGVQSAAAPHGAAMEGWRACAAPLRRLDAELKLLSAAHAASGESAQHVQACRKTIERRARRLVPDISAHLFGSQAAGLETSTSDMDVVLLSPTRFSDSLLPERRSRETDKLAKADKVGFLYELARTLTPAPFARVKVIGDASVPIIKGTTGRGVRCDISVGSEGGLRSSDMMRRSLASIAELRPLVVFLKLLLKEKGLNEVFTGGLSSYAIFHLVLSFLYAQSSAPTAPQPPRPASVSATAFPYVVNTTARAEHAKHADAAGAGLQLPNMGQQLVEMCELYGGGHGFEPMRHAICSRRGLVPRWSTHLSAPDGRFRCASLYLSPARLAVRLKSPPNPSLARMCTMLKQPTYQDRKSVV